MKVLEDRASAHGVLQPYWDKIPVIALISVLAIAPLLWPAVPPLTDYLAHMGRYYISLHGADTGLSRYFEVDWELLGNLGGDLAIIPLARVMDFEWASKVLAMAVPALLALGLLTASRSAHGRLPATSLFALPLVYSYPFQWGFINFCLSMALAFLCFALWIRLAERRRSRALSFPLLASIVWITHAYGWGVLGLLVFGWEWSSARARGLSLTGALRVAIVTILPLTPPILLMILWRSGHATTETSGFFDLAAKAKDLLMIVRDRWMILDVAFAALMLLIALTSLHRRLADPRLRAGAALLLLAFIVMPWKLLGSGYADLRLAPFVVAVAILSIRPTRHDRAIAIAALTLFVLRLAATSWSYMLYDRDYREQLDALAHVAPHSRLFVQVEGPCEEWGKRRLEHLASLAIVRRGSFVNDQWVAAGAQALRVHYPAAGQFQADPSQIFYPARCNLGPSPLAERLATVPRDAFDFVWLIGAQDELHDRGLVKVWHGRTGGSLCRIMHDR